MRNFLRGSYVKVEPDIKKLRLKGDGIVAGELLEKMVFQAGTSTGYDALESPRKGKKRGGGKWGKRQTRCQGGGQRQAAAAAAAAATPNDHQSSRARQSNSAANRRTAVASLSSNRTRYTLPACFLKSPATGKYRVPRLSFSLFIVRYINHDLYRIPRPFWYHRERIEWRTERNMGLIKGWLNNELWREYRM